MTLSDHIHVTVNNDMRAFDVQLMILPRVGEHLILHGKSKKIRSIEHAVDANGVVYMICINVD